MATWVVTQGDQRVVIETSPDGSLTLRVGSGEPFVTGPDVFEEIRLAIGAAIVDVGGTDVRG